MKRSLTLRLIATLIAGLLAMTNEPSAAATRIKFSDFYIGETYQAGVGMTPRLKLSDTVKNLNGKPVEIFGFMDGILPRDGMHFMLLREPSFVCPFHDVSYDWAGFAAIFLARPTDYIDGPLRITGRLDVGEKKDEMGLVSYVRIYDAAIARAQ